jgi:hypothetical protein
MARNYVFSTTIVLYRARDIASRVARILYISKLAQDRPRRRAARMIRDVCVQLARTETNNFPSFVQDAPSSEASEVNGLHITDESG